MRVLAKSTIDEFVLKYPESSKAARLWFLKVSESEWKNPQDVKADFATASILKNNRLVFNLMGNKFRIVVAINYPSRIVFIKFMGSHLAYNQIDANTVQFQRREL